jgi:mono/diheme cytochrome c family protein
MRRFVILLLAFIVIGVPVALGLVGPARISEAQLGPHTPDIENGRVMFFTGGCASCHATPNQDDAMRLGGGRALPSQFGTFRVPNISPHIEDGVGNWSEAQFVSAMLKGTSPAGEHYYPAFPYTSYQRMNIADVRDLFAFIKTLPAVAGRTADHDLPFPFNLRAGLGIWKYSYLDGRTFRPDPSKSEQWNRGAYLVEGPGHCAECHSPRDFMGGIIGAQRMAGGPNPTGEGSVPNITQHPDGLSDWSEGDIAYLLETGNKPDFDTVGGDMGLVVRNMAQLPPDDRAAMAHYLKSLEPVAGRRSGN